MTTAAADNTVIEEIIVYGKKPEAPSLDISGDVDIDAGDLLEVKLPKMEIPEFKLGPCNIMPTKQDFANSLMQLSAIPGKLAVIAETMVNEELEAAAAELEEMLDELAELLGPCAPDWETIDIPERQWETTVDCLIREYPCYVQSKILELIDKIIGVSFEIPIPPLPIKIDIVKFFTDPEYKKELKKKFAGLDDATKELIQGKIDELTEMFAGGCTEKVIESGDTLSQIAVDNNTTVDALMKANPTIKDANVIKAGDTLAITGTGEACAPGILEMTIVDMMDSVRGGIIDELYELLPDEAKSFGGEFGLEITELKAEAVWAYIQTKLEGGATGLMWDLFDKLIGKFDKIWKALGLPDLPIPLDMDIGAWFKEIYEREKKRFLDDVDKLSKELDDLERIEAMDELKDAMTDEIMNALADIKIGPFSLEDFCGGIDEEFIAAENKLKRCKESLAELKENYWLWLVKKWMDLVTSFLEAIGLGKLMEWATLDFCDFLKLMGVPEKITVPDLLMGIGLVTLGSGNDSKTDRVGNQATFSHSPDEQALKDRADAMPRFTAAANQTTFSGTDNKNVPLSYTAGAISVFKSGVSLEDYIIDETDGDKILLEDGEDIVYEVSSQYTATNGSSVVLTDSANDGDVIFIVPEAA